MGQIKIATMRQNKTTGEMIRHEGVVNKPNLMEWEVYCNANGEMVHRGCASRHGMIVRNTRKKPGATRRHLKSSWLMHLGYEPCGKFFCLACNDILGKQAVAKLLARAGLSDEPFIHEKAVLDGEPPKVVEIRLWRYLIYTEEEAVEAAAEENLDEPQDETPF